MIPKMTVEEALQWVDMNCQPESVERLRSRAVAAVLAEEVRRRYGIGGELAIARKQRDELLSDGKQFVTIQDCRDGVWAHFRVGKGYASINLSADQMGIGFAKEFSEAIASAKGNET